MIHSPLRQEPRYAQLLCFIVFSQGIGWIACGDLHTRHSSADRSIVTTTIIEIEFSESPTPVFNSASVSSIGYEGGCVEGNCQTTPIGFTDTHYVSGGPGAETGETIYWGAAAINSSLGSLVANNAKSLFTVIGTLAFRVDSPFINESGSGNDRSYRKFVGTAQSASAGATFTNGANITAVDVIFASKVAVGTVELEDGFTFTAADPATLVKITAGEQTLAFGSIGVSRSGQRFATGDFIVSEDEFTLSSSIQGFSIPAGQTDFSIETMSILPGDLDEDSDVDADDIDLLTIAISNNQQVNPDPIFDLFDIDIDGQIDDVDTDMLVEVLIETAYGDANLDGTVDSADFDIVSANLYQSGGWAEGDFDGNGTVNFSDFSILAVNMGFEAPWYSGETIASLPEPASLALLLLGAMSALMRLRTCTMCD